jgi:hypothetical protein
MTGPPRDDEASTTRNCCASQCARFRSRYAIVPHMITHTTERGHLPGVGVHREQVRRRGLEADGARRVVTKPSIRWRLE